VPPRLLCGAAILRRCIAKRQACNRLHAPQPRRRPPGPWATHKKI